ncbi:MAG TPA: TIGR03000 domain-containing protein [Gemmataceae bacterium]|nr:TIGR03000 domain-containing protein [Gemmataceae bacterium]
MQRRYVVLPWLVLGALFLAPLSAAFSQEAGKKKISLTVYVPQNDAILTIDGVATRQFGTTRTFISPPLDIKGKAGEAQIYTYTLKTIWEPNNYTKITRTKKVKIDPGTDTNLKIDLATEDARWKDDIVVRFVPTPVKVVDAMCKLAKVGKDDIVYDLGCGDGVMVIRAVEKFGAKRGVGIDLDPQRVKESKDNAKKAKVEAKVEFRQGDVLKIDDIPDATVVLLYMGNDINLRLRPILQAKLKPGSRIVSHRFTMGDWEPTATETIKVTDPNTSATEDFLIHLWIIGENKM